MHAPGLQNQRQAVPRHKKVGLQCHSGTPSHASDTNSFLGSVAAGPNSSNTARCKPTTTMDRGSSSLQARSACTKNRDGQVVSVARRNETVEQVNDLFDREKISQRTITKQTARIQELEAAQATVSQANSNQTTRISELEKENGRLRGRMKQQKEENEQLRKKVAVFDVDLKTSTAEKEVLAKQKAELESRLLAAEQKSQEEERHHENAERERQKLQAKVEELVERTSSSETHIKLFDQQKTELLESVHNLEKKASMAEAGAETLRASNESLLKEKETLVSKIECAFMQHRILEKQIEALRADLAKRNDDFNKVETLTDEVQYQKGVIEDLSTQRDQLLAEQRGKENELNHLRKFLDEDNDESLDLRRTVHNQQKTLNNQQRRINDFNKDLELIHKLRLQKKAADGEAAVRAAELDDLRSRIAALERSRNELYELFYAENERVSSYDEDYNYIFAHKWELAEAERRAEMVDLRARGEEFEKTLKERHQKLGQLETQFANLQDELEPTKRDLTSTRISLQVSQAQKDKLSSELEQKLAFKQAEIISQQEEYCRINGKMAQERSDAEIATKKLKEQLAALEASLEAAEAAKLALKQDVDELKLKASETPSDSCAHSRASHDGKRYASKYSMQADIFGNGDEVILAMELYWKAIGHFYHDVPDHRVKITMNDRVLPRGVERVCDGNCATAIAEIGPQESLPPTSGTMAAELLVEKPWKLAGVDFTGVDLKKPGPDASGLLDRLLTCAICEVAADNNLGREAMASPSQLHEMGTAPMHVSAATLVTECEEQDEDSLFVPETAGDDLGSGDVTLDAVAPTAGDHGGQDLQARSDSVINKQTQFVPPADMSPQRSVQSPLKENASSEVFSQNTVSRIRTDVASTASDQSLPTPLPTPAEERPGKRVRWVEGLATPRSPVNQSACISKPLKRHAADSDMLARAPKQPRLSRLPDQYDQASKRESIPRAADSSSARIHRRPVRCCHDPRCKRINCYNAHQTAAVSVRVDIDVNRLCDQEEDCNDTRCRLSHASWGKCMKIPPREKRYSEPMLDDRRRATAPRAGGGSHEYGRDRRR